MKVPREKSLVKNAPTVVTAGTATMSLTEVKGIGEKRAMQLKALGIASVDELSKALAKRITKKLKISPKIVNKWIDNAERPR
jgi:predicted flap endonuclease-1-like 5' DNA nuclease